MTNLSRKGTYWRILCSTQKCLEGMEHGQETKDSRPGTTATDEPQNWSHGKFTADELDLTYPWAPDAGGSWILLVLHSRLFLLNSDSPALLHLGITSFHSVRGGDFWLVKPGSWASSLPAKEVGKVSVRCFPQKEAIPPTMSHMVGSFSNLERGFRSGQCPKTKARWSLHSVIFFITAEWI